MPLLAVGSRATSVHLVSLDAVSGAMQLVASAAGIAKPAFVAVHPSAPIVYAASAILEPEGALVAFSLEGDHLREIGRRGSGAPDPCHLSLAPSGRHVFVAHYRSATITVLPLDADGAIGEPSARMRLSGKGPHPQRQDHAYAHQIMPDHAGRHVLACDLGSDRVAIFRFDPVSGGLAEHGAATLAPGSGPRHLAFSPDGRFAYVANELSSTVTAFAYDAGSGSLSSIATVSTLPAGFIGENFPAGILVSPDGRFVYLSNRGHDSIAGFAVDRASGALSPATHAPAQGSWPWSIAMDPAGGFLIAANHHSDALASFAIDRATCALDPAATLGGIEKPSGVAFVP